MQCFRCNERETALGQMLCWSCQGKVSSDEAIVQAHEAARRERWRNSTYTWLYFCAACHTEIYRDKQVPRRRNRRQEEERNKQARLALFKHALEQKHSVTALHGPTMINDLSGDDEYEVPAMGLPEDRCPRHMQASSVMRVLGETP